MLSPKNETSEGLNCILQNDGHSGEIRVNLQEQKAPTKGALSVSEESGQRESQAPPVRSAQQPGSCSSTSLGAYGDLCEATTT